ncbi:2-succinyl-6-hydroxy-2,4-cyclohexadiene-1-carboxylate synthase [Vagococcus vulneris]|uniref:Putative 2-succinyl-6-hydroxy-2,4-cyclohexadiene-1-carboxylate synthase n=1 Tax=Vagococcus vulneris TaxID=1977869 RepID=A0A429ZY95_9ENTE|nr:2-succinyl-6-hydroxy-2,4-cyclohexadiene-1-carboxylate synthase [Vagococcus vulneris]RST98916.1 2-succinyl-6-hydroxy-2,4-cyclohexadiene-1-carboxylate synthase [Vagococcus vulneris]
MRQKIDGHYYTYHWTTPYQKDRPTLLCLHGFTGTGQTFSCLKDVDAYNILILDLIGHGSSAAPQLGKYYQFDYVLSIIDNFLNSLSLTKVDVLGYSMGARTALGFTLDYPEKVNQLIMESGTPGIECPKERQKRQKQDHQLAEEIEHQGIEAFVDSWERLPLFATQNDLPALRRIAIRNERLAQKKVGLANSLRFMGTGVMPNYWPRLKELLHKRVVLIVGTKDEKFSQIAMNMKIFQPTIQVVTVKHAGHCIHLEQPDKFISIINQMAGE